jgi:CobQ-like glutamine amidotransferase family enzyme
MSVTDWYWFGRERRPITYDHHSTKVLRDRIGELEAQVALLTRDCELLGGCNDRLRTQLDKERLAAASEIKAQITKVNHLLWTCAAMQTWKS